jgi:multiple sugar transport system permease protein
VTSPSPLRKALSYAVLLVLGVVFVGPILYMVIGSLKPSDEVLAGVSGFKPSHLSLDNYSGVVGRFDSAATGHFHDFYLRWRGRGLVLVGVIVLIIIPFEAIAVPLFYMLNGHRNTYYVQFLPFIANALSIFLFYAFFAGLPRQLEEAARVDGAGPWRTFLLIVVPLSKPVYATVAILTFLFSWGSFLWPVLVVDDPNVRPLPLEISVFQGQPPYDWGQIFAFGVMLVAPILLVFLLFQRWFVRSVASVGVKG